MVPVSGGRPRLQGGARALLAPLSCGARDLSRVPRAASSRRISAGSACWQGKPWFLREGGRFLDRNRFRRLDASIVRYLAALDRADRDESDVAEAGTTRIKDKIARLRQQMQALRAMKEKVQDAPDQQISLTDPDARSMATSGRGTGIVGYNVQTAVDAEHHLIVAHEVINVGHDRAQLEPMARRAHDAMGCEELIHALRA